MTDETESELEKNSIKGCTERRCSKAKDSSDSSYKEKSLFKKGGYSKAEKGLLLEGIEKFGEDKEKIFALLPNRNRRSLSVALVAARKTKKKLD